MKEAMFWKPEKDNIHCFLCPNECKIQSDYSGNCLVRENKNNELFTKVFDVQSSVHIDPIEKKPLYHFFPGSKALSIGTVGCNFHCKNCQNADISQSIEYLETQKQSPEKIIALAKENGCESISYTYNEPTIFIEQVLEIAKLAKKNGIKNTIVSNGYINEIPQKELLKYIDAANIDIKAMNEDSYKSVCGAKLQPVLEAVKRYKKIHLEITRLVIPGLSDDKDDFEKLCVWIKDNLGKETPLHISRFHPMYKLSDSFPTPEKIILDFYKIAKKHLDFVYIGNMQADNNTYCPKCNSVLIERPFYEATKISRICKCGYKIEGSF